MNRYGKPAEIVPQMLEAVSRNEDFWLTVTGYSMAPTLRHLRDGVCISPLDRKAKKGDILLTRAKGNRCLLHRVIRTDGDYIYYKGDAQDYIEGPFPAADVIGIATKIRRNGNVFPVSDSYIYLCAIR